MTKRLFAYLGLTMLSVYTVVFYFGVYGICAAVLFAVVVAVFAVFVKRYRPNRRVLVFVAVVALISTVLFSVYDGVFKSVSERYMGENVNITAQVKSDGVKNGGTYNYELSARKIDDENTDVKVMLFSNHKLSCEYGDTISFRARLKTIGGNYYRSRHYMYAAESDEYILKIKILSRGGSDIFHIPAEIQRALSESVRSIVPDSEGELCAAVAFGDRASLSDEVNGMFSKTGLSFLVVVSGLHMSIISMFLLFLLKPLGKRRRGEIIRCIIVVLFIIFYMMITGCTASVIRSGIAVILATIAIVVRRRSDSFNSLGLAAFLLVALNPYAVGDIGMLLSFSSVAGILFFTPKLLRRFNDYYLALKSEYTLEIRRTNQKKRQFWFRIKYVLAVVTESVIKAIFVSLSAVVASSPIVCLAIGYVNPATIVFSIFLTPLIACVMVAALLTALFSYIPLLGFLSYLCGAVADLAASVILYIVRMVSSAKYLTLYVDRNTFWLWMLALALLLGAAFLLRRSKGTVAAAVVLSVVFLAGCCGAKYYVQSSRVTAKIISLSEPLVRISGKGVEALLTLNCDADKTDELIRVNRSSFGGVKTLVLPDDSLRTSRLACEILNEFDVESVMMYHSNRTALDTELKAMSCKNYREFYNSDVIKLRLSDSITDTVINDGKSTWQYIQSPNTTMLIAPDKADADKLDIRYRKAGVIVCGSEIKNIDLLGGSGSDFVTGGAENVNIRLD